MQISKTPKLFLSGFLISALTIALTTNSIIAEADGIKNTHYSELKFHLASSAARAYEIVHDALAGIEKLFGSVPCENCGEEDHDAAVCTEEPISNHFTGTFTIPDVDVEADCFNSSAQFVCDAKNSACYFPLGSQTIIADHWYQGFNGIKFCEEGTTAYFETDSGVQEYVCTGVIKGHNKITDLTDENGNSIVDINPGGITCYTCNFPSWENITIVFFQPV